jgi:hypothetical protein
MEARKQKQATPKPMRWNDADWARLAEVARSVGLSRSEFVRRAAIGAAKALEIGFNPYYVEGPKATSHNTRINFSGSEGDIKAAPGGRRAPVRSRSDCGAKDGPNEEIDDPKDENPTGGKV